MTNKNSHLTELQELEQLQHQRSSSRNQQFSQIYRRSTKTINRNDKQSVSKPIAGLFIPIVLVMLMIIAYTYLNDKVTKTETNVWQKGEIQFLPNRQVWIYQIPNMGYLQKLKFQNILRMATASNFKVNIIDQKNYQSYLSTQGNRKLLNIIDILRSRQSIDTTNLKFHIKSIQKLLISLMILYEKGGVLLQSGITLTENLDWIRTIRTNPYVNRGNRKAKPQVVGFFSPYYSSRPQKHNKIPYPGMQQIQKYMVLLPAMQKQLIAAQQKAQFLRDLLEQIIDILTYPDQLTKDIQTKKYNYIHFDQNEIYYQYFIHACHRVLRNKQIQLDKETEGWATGHFAIDYYGLNLINCYYGPYKLHVHFKNVDSSKIIQSFARLDLQQFQANVGPLRYILVQPILTELNDFLIRLIDTSQTQNPILKGVMKGSFVQKMYFPEANEPFIYENTQDSFVDSKAQAWSTLPKIIWFFWEEGFSNKSNIPAPNILFVQNINKKAKASSFQVREVNNSNLQSYLENKTVQNIQNILNSTNNSQSVKIRSNLYRLALLYQQGGIYLDPCLIAIQNFDWIVNIARFPTKYIYNRYGNLPRVFLFWEQNFGGAFEWEISTAYRTKTDWGFSIQNSFIAAEKQNEFIKEWFDTYCMLLLKPAKQAIQILEDNGVVQKWTTENNFNYLSLDAGKLVLAMRQRRLQQGLEILIRDTGRYSSKMIRWESAADYYKIWSANGLTGFFKIKPNTNYDNEDRKGLNVYLTRFSQQYVEGILGKINFMIKISSAQRPGLSKFLLQYSGNYFKEVHSHSIFRRHIYNEKYNKVQLVNGKTVVQVS